MGTTFPIIVAGALKIEVGGGLVDVSQRAYREPYERKLVLAPKIAREVAHAMLAAADAAEGRENNATVAA